MTASPFRDPSPASEEDARLRAALQGGQLRQLPAHIEAAFRRRYDEHNREQVRRHALPQLGLLALIAIPGWLFRHDPSLLPFLLCGVAPIAATLGLLALAARGRDSQGNLPALMAGGCFACLAAALFCAMYLDGQYFGHVSKFLAIYVLITTFTVLQLPVRTATPVALGATLAALLGALALGRTPFWLEVAYYSVVPLFMCSITGYTLESSARRDFLQRHLLEREQQQLARLHAETERNMRAQQLQAEYLALIGGNHSLKELFTRTLRFLVEHTGAQVGAGYHLGTRGQLRRVASWALAGSELRLAQQEFAPEDTLMGPALASGEPLHLRRVPADYLKVELGMGSLPCASALVLPIVQAGKPLAVVELGKVTGFSDEEVARAEAVRTHLAYAVAAANARAVSLRAATA